MEMKFYAGLFIVICFSVLSVSALSVRQLQDVSEPTNTHVTHQDYEPTAESWMLKEDGALEETSEPPRIDPQIQIRTEHANHMKMYMDMLADPCDDFYQYACGNWEKNNPIPDDHFEYNVFSLLQENLYDSLKTILSEKPTTVLDGSIEPSAEDKAKYFYKSCMDTETRERNAEKPLLEFLNQFGGWPATASNWTDEGFNWIDLSAKLSRYMPNNLIRTSVDGDLRESNRNIIYIDEPTLGLPRRDIYLMSTNTTYMLAYREFIKDITHLLGTTKEVAEQTADEIIAFERELAKIKTGHIERLDLDDLYNKMNVSELLTTYPDIDWTSFFYTIFGSDVTNSTQIILLAKKYAKQVTELVVKTDKRIVRNYILWKYVKDLSEDLDGRFEKVNSKLSQVILGRENPPPKWKTCIRLTNRMLGMPVGALFVRKHFDESSKADVIQLTRELQQSFRDALKENSWIDKPTRKKAEEKANEIRLAVGYPDDILRPDKLNDDYKEFKIDPNNYFKNSLNLALFENKRTLGILNKPVDKEEWAGYPAVINAYFEQSNNRIIIPAGILQPPIYNRHLPKALNYGGIGIFVGHELTHGFDDTGRNFDKMGDMKQWWTQSSVNAFKEQGECFAGQYSQYALHGKNVNGLVSKGENIADNGGLRQAYKAYEKWLKEHHEESENEFLPGLNITGKKLFYLGFAQVWCGTIRPEAVDNKLETDSHSPGKFRVLGSLSNFEEFSKEFECSTGATMNPESKCKIW